MSDGSRSGGRERGRRALPSRAAHRGPREAEDDQREGDRRPAVHGPLEGSPAHDPEGAVRRPGAQAGLTLIEVLVSLTIFAIVLAGLARLLIHDSQVNREEQMAAETQ